MPLVVHDRQTTFGDLLSELLTRGNGYCPVARAMPNRNRKSDLTERNIPARSQQQSVCENAAWSLPHRLVHRLYKCITVNAFAKQILIRTGHLPCHPIDHGCWSPSTTICK